MQWMRSRALPCVVPYMASPWMRVTHMDIGWEYISLHAHRRITGREDCCHPRACLSKPCKDCPFKSLEKSLEYPLGS